MTVLRRETPTLQFARTEFHGIVHRKCRFCEHPWGMWPSGEGHTDGTKPCRCGCTIYEPIAPSENVGVLNYSASLPWMVRLLYRLERKIRLWRVDAEEKATCSK